jgi:Zn-finger nucleic acid-binding protein
MAESLNCPSCQVALTQAGRTERCARCDGAWIHEDVLVGMLQETASAVVLLPWLPREPRAAPEPEQPRSCAVCARPMQPVSLGTVPLDRCAEHGVWFDASELADVLRHAKEFKADPSKHPDDHRAGLLGVLGRLFGG